MPTDGRGGEVQLPLQTGLHVEAKRRIVLLRQTPPQSLLISGKRARVAGREDVLHGLSAEQAQAVKIAQARPYKGD